MPETHAFPPALLHPTKPRDSTPFPVISRRAITPPDPAATPFSQSLSQPAPPPKRATNHSPYLSKNDVPTVSNNTTSA